MDFGQIFREHSGYIYSIAYKLSADAHSAEDIAQETFLSAIEKQGSLRDENSIKPWLRKICVNIFLMKKRAEKNAPALSYDEISGLESEGAAIQIKSNDPLPIDEVIVDEFVRDLKNGCFLAMSRKLTLEQRAVFSLMEMFGLSIEETAEILGMSLSAAKALLHRARTNIFNFFAGHCQWVEADNPCKCEAWYKFAGDREAIRSEVKKRGGDSDFPEKPMEKENISDSKKRRILFLYREIPDYKPSDDWYRKIIESL